MLDDIEKLLVVQDRDRRIARLKMELAQIPTERQELLGKVSQSQADLEAARQQTMHCESERKRLELDIESKKELIARYANQQFQTRKNEEFRALGHEIDTNKKAIFEIENSILEIMEQTEASQRAVAAAGKVAGEAKKLADEKVAKLNEREQNLQKELAELEANRQALAAGVDESTLSRYERLMKSKGDNVVVGIEGGVCGGCHMRISRQTVVDCRSSKAIVQCLNCGRIIYYAPGMEVDAIE